MRYTSCTENKRCITKILILNARVLLPHQHSQPALFSPYKDNIDRKRTRASHMRCHHVRVTQEARALLTPKNFENTGCVSKGTLHMAVAQRNGHSCASVATCTSCKSAPALVSLSLSLWRLPQQFTPFDKGHSYVSF